MPGVEDGEGSGRDAFLNSSHHPVFRIGRNDHMGICFLCGRYLSGKRHRSWVERGNLPTDLVPDYEAMGTERIGKSLDELRPDSKRFKPFYVGICVLSYRCDDIRILAEQGEVVCDIPCRSTVFSTYFRSEEGKIEAVESVWKYLALESSGGAYDRIEGYGTGDEYGHVVRAVYSVSGSSNFERHEL